MSENLKKLYDPDGRWWKSLYFHNVPLKDIIVKVEPYNRENSQDSRKKETMLFYASVKTSKGYESYHVTISPKFRDWINKNTLYDCGLYFEIIQQRTYNKDKLDTYHDSFLVLLGYDQILGSNWLDYKTEAEIREVFKND